MQPYAPKPIDTSAIELSDDLLELLEQLAMNTHAVWAEGRIQEGWSFGTNRDDEKMEHPGLVPYDELTEGEKDYDRQTSEQTLKAVLALGFEIVKKS